MRAPKEKLSVDVQADYIQNIFRNILIELGSSSNDLLDIFTKVASLTSHDKNRVKTMLDCFVSTVFDDFDNAPSTEKSYDFCVKTIFAQKNTNISI